MAYSVAWCGVAQFAGPVGSSARVGQGTGSPGLGAAESGTPEPNRGNMRQISGASGNSVGLRVEVKTAAVEVDGGLEVVPVAVAACRDADGLDARVEPLGTRTGDPVVKEGE